MSAGRKMRIYRDDVSGVVTAIGPRVKLPPCLRCGKPCPTPVHEYCGAHCSARRREPYPQTDELDSLRANRRPP